MAAQNGIAKMPNQACAAAGASSVPATGGANQRRSETSSIQEHQALFVARPAGSERPQNLVGEALPLCPAADADPTYGSSGGGPTPAPVQMATRTAARIDEGLG